MYQNKTITTFSTFKVSFKMSGISISEKGNLIKEKTEFLLLKKKRKTYAVRSPILPGHVEAVSKKE